MPAPEAFDSWKRIVSIPIRIIKPNLVTNHGVRASYQFHDEARFWSGYVLRPSDKRNYVRVQGTWKVPKVEGGSDSSTSHAVLWVGLDGWWKVWDHNDLVQAGTGCDCTKVQFLEHSPSFRTLNIHFSTYYPWIELLPQQQSMIIINNFEVKPDNEIYVLVTMLPTSNTGTLLDGECWFFVHQFNYKNANFDYCSPRPECNDSSWLGRQAGLWRRLCIAGFLHIFANYTTATITNAYAMDNFGRQIPYQSGASLQVTMINGLNVHFYRRIN